MGSQRVGHDWALSLSLASMWDEHSCAVIWTFFGIAFLWDWNENWPFPALWLEILLVSVDNNSLEAETTFSAQIYISDTIFPMKRPRCTWKYVLLFIRLVAQSCLTLHDSMGCSTAVFPFHHQLPELAQTNVHWVGDAVQPSHPPSSHLLLPSIFPSIRVFSNELALLIRWS